MTSKLVALLVTSLAVAACRSGSSDQRPQIVQPGAPGESSRVVTAGSAADQSKIVYTGDDVQFMQGMIGHHAQAVEMTALLSTRTTREDMRLLGRRIELSQADEIKMMERWLRAHGRDVPAAHLHDGHAAMLMPGMLAPDEMSRLAGAKGAEFDRLFLEGMIKHHEGALTMVRELLARPGAGQEPEMFAFLSDVDADQRAEIDRMRAMLDR